MMALNFSSYPNFDRHRVFLTLNSRVSPERRQELVAIDDGGQLPQVFWKPSEQANSPPPIGLAKYLPSGRSAPSLLQFYIGLLRLNTEKDLGNWRLLDLLNSKTAEMGIAVDAANKVQALLCEAVGNRVDSIALKWEMPAS